VVGVRELLVAAAEEVAGGAVEQAAQRGVHAQVDALGREEGHPDRRRLEGHLQEPLGLLEEPRRIDPAQEDEAPACLRRRRADLDEERDAVTAQRLGAGMTQRTGDRVLERAAAQDVGERPPGRVVVEQASSGGR
jgi:hypothetical protein